MGMYDTIRIHGEAAPRCSAGHRVGDLQTKDLDCAMAVYSLHDQRLYRPAKERDESAAIDDRGRLILTEARICEPASITAEVCAYTHCEECLPVLYLCEPGMRGDRVQERRSWCEWRLVFRDGRLERYEPVRFESRESVADALRREGLEVLADDERLARLHFERASKRGWSDW